MAYRDGPVTGDAISAQLGAAYGRFSAADRSRHVELLRSVRRAEDVALHAEKANGQEWTVTVCTTDCVGALAVIVGLSAAYRFDIRGADVFTLHFAPSPRQPRAPLPYRRSRRRPLPAGHSRAPGQILDIFQVRAPDPGGQEVW